MAEYIKQEMCDLNGTGEKPVYYRMKIQRNMDMEDFVERITYPGSGLSRGSVIQVMTTVAEHLAYCMAEGQSVTLEEERRTRALDYLHEHPFLRIQDYMAITGLKRSSANRELLRLSSDPASGLTISGYGSHRVYVRRKTEGDR